MIFIQQGCQAPPGVSRVPKRACRIAALPGPRLPQARLRLPRRRAAKFHTLASLGTACKRGSEAENDAHHLCQISSVKLKLAAMRPPGPPARSRAVAWRGCAGFNALSMGRTGLPVRLAAAGGPLPSAARSDGGALGESSPRLGAASPRQGHPTPTTSGPVPIRQRGPSRWAGGLWLALRRSQREQYLTLFRVLAASGWAPGGSAGGSLIAGEAFEGSPVDPSTH